MALRIRALAALVALLGIIALAPAAALAQDTPFGPVPTPEPTVAPVPGSADDDVGRTTLYLIAGGVLVIVVAIGFLISRDARRSLSPEDREALEREARGERLGSQGEEPVPGQVSREARARARKQRGKAKAAKRARRHNRPR